MVDVQGSANKLDLGDSSTLIYRRNADGSEEFRATASRERKGAAGSGGISIKAPWTP
jgi:hypothetical protein